MKKASGSIIAFTDADTIVPSDWVERIMQTFSADPKLIGVGGIQKPLEGRWIEYVTFTLFLNLFSRFRGFVGFYELSTTNCAYRKDIFLKAGGFDESMTMMEDTVLSLKVEKIGKLRIDKNLTVSVSTRRMRQERYRLIFLQYLKAYLYYFTKRPIKVRYFDVIEH